MAHAERVGRWIITVFDAETVRDGKRWKTAFKTLGPHEIGDAPDLIRDLQKAGWEWTNSWSENPQEPPGTPTTETFVFQFSVGEATDSWKERW